MDGLFNGQSSLENQFSLSVVEFVCPQCQKTPDATEETGSTITLQPCGHTFHRSDLTTVIKHLCALDDLVQYHDAAATPFERQEVQEEIHAVGVEFDAATERCTAHIDTL
jgi:hypothetical protein